jgi:hypothetical protein
MDRRICPESQSIRAVSEVVSQQLVAESGIFGWQMKRCSEAAGHLLSGNARVYLHYNHEIYFCQTGQWKTASYARIK